ncbi:MULTISPECIES: DUF3574 domain-containing protein [Leclercia]|jgi:hypothetical protein|uniref:DUF3574 domain-containing protein n=1 Tax=Leclercia adecarboxylata TaxID=83655 RepID=A0ABU6I9B7_9ENTR|nr:MULTISPECIES: DUF3574 domain-containing protein [Leclercia]POW70456.1 DUF3574 domain-containing protein [Leclercia sp. LSNIH4]AUY37838.1 DUF3574 domain-containing protein [Leclercia sp. LSNIH3]MBZ3802966.1 DUF3574 domain-containing protein [Leclercia adecarboxylata]MBZ3807744.1 DUF3574 domain-containing protein [Leclercia adecarboxylata]MCE9980236.1 DUF3574 domain-containing protein [Leclercia adecarboxylata]
MIIKTGLMAGALLLLAGCNAPSHSTADNTCKADNQMQQTTLYFGLNRPAGEAITGQEWQQFVDQDVTPRFRDGLTVFEARGQWLGNDGKVARESSKALMLIHGKDARSESNIEALRGIYKQRFAQESVMRVDQPVCVQF